MRVTNQMVLHNNLYDYQNKMQMLNSGYNQLGGTKISNGFENSSIYADGMRLNYEITTLEQVIDTSNKAQSFAKNTDKSMNEITSQLEKFKVKLISAGNGIHSTTSYHAIAKEMQAIRDYLKDIANTSINGRYIFSGSATKTKPISNDGNYHGNDQSVKTLVGSGVSIPYNIDGYNLFLGRDSDYHKKITGNVRLKDQIPDSVTGKLPDEYITENSTIRQVVGDYNAKSVFYLQGRKPNGESFTSRFDIDADSKVEDLMTEIGIKYGNDPKKGHNVVEVGISKYGQIYVKDLRQGNDQLEFNMVAATDKDPNLTKEDVGYAKFDRLYPRMYPPVPVPHDDTAVPKEPKGVDDFYIVNADGTTTDVTLDGNSREPDVKFTYFMKSKFERPDGLSTDGIDDTESYSYRSKFDKDGDKLIQNVSQKIAGTNHYANETTKLLQVAYTAEEIAATPPATMEGRTMTLRVHTFDKIKTDSQDGKDLVVTINFDAAGTTAEVSTDTNPPVPLTTINVGGVAGKAPDDITYQDIQDLISIVASDNVPGTLGAPANYNDALTESKKYLNLDMDSGGRIVIKDKIDKEKTEVKIRMTNIVPVIEERPTSYDKTRFIKNGDELLGNVSQVVRKTNEFATDTTKLSEVAGLDSVPEGSPKPSLDGKTLALRVTDKNGRNFTIRIDFNSNVTAPVAPTPPATEWTPPIGGSTFTVYEGDMEIPIDIQYDTTVVPPVPLSDLPQPIIHSQIYQEADKFAEYKGEPTKADDVTYKQINDIIAMVTSDNMPKGTATDFAISPHFPVPAPFALDTTTIFSPTFEQYNDAISRTEGSVEVKMDYKGRISVLDKQHSKTNIEISMYDATHTTIGTAGVGGNPPSYTYTRESTGTFSENEERVGFLSFSANNAVSLEEPSIDFFKELDEMIEAVKNGRVRADGNSDDPRNIGIQGGIEKIDHIIDHSIKEHTKIGAFSNAIINARDRAEVLKVNVKSIKSEIIDTDIGEAILKMQQLALSYQALMSSISKINSLSLLNHM